MKRIFIINGEAGSGKDTFVSLCADVLGSERVVNVSTVDPIKKMAMIAGWDGEKTPGARKFLSDLKDLCEEAFNTSYVYVKMAVEAFNESEAEIMFIHSREPAQIERFCRDFGASSLLIVRDNYETAASNHADADVYKYHYDVSVKNPGDSLRLYGKLAKLFCEQQLSEKEY